jgi:hypothetical protein
MPFFCFEAQARTAEAQPNTKNLNFVLGVCGFFFLVLTGPPWFFHSPQKFRWLSFLSPCTIPPI